MERHPRHWMGRRPRYFMIIATKPDRFPTFQRSLDPQFGHLGTSSR
jgi:hypothetical protein